MSEKTKKQVRVLDLYYDHKEAIEAEYEAGSTYSELAVMFECSENTIKIALRVFGYESEPWTKVKAENALEAIKRADNKRVKTVV